MLYKKGRKKCVTWESQTIDSMKRNDNSVTHVQRREVKYCKLRILILDKVAKINKIRSQKKKKKVRLFSENISVSEKFKKNNFSNEFLLNLCRVFFPNWIILFFQSKKPTTTFK